MERLTGKQAKSLVEAYQQVYAPVITEEVLNQSADQWVAACIEEDINFEEYTLDEITEAFIADCEQPGILNEFLGMGGAQNVGADLRQRFGQARRAVGGALSKVGAGVKDVAGAAAQGLVGQKTTSQNPLARASNAFTRYQTAIPRAGASLVGGFLTGKRATPAGTRPTTPPASTVADRSTTAPATPARPATPAAPARPTGAADPRNQQYQKDRAAIATAAPEAKAAATKKAETSGMAAWAKANPALAAKVRPGQAGYDTIQRTLNPSKTATPAAGSKVAPASGEGRQALGQASTATSKKTAPAAKVTPATPAAGSKVTPAAKVVPDAATVDSKGNRAADLFTGKKNPKFKAEGYYSEGIVDAIKTVARKALEPADNSPEAQAARVNARRPQNAQQREVGRRTQEVLNREEYDNFDLIQAYLIDEGVTESEALTIMSVMEDEQREEILEVLDTLKRIGKGVSGAVRGAVDHVTKSREFGNKGGHDLMPWNKNSPYNTKGERRQPGTNIHGEKITTGRGNGGANKTTGSITADGKPRRF